MLQREGLKTYARYVIPSAIAFALSSIYSVVDGLFVGQMVGDAGIAGVNVAYPLVALVLAVGTGIGMGGAVIGTVRMGAGQYDRARQVVGHTIMMLILASVPLMIILQLCAAPLLYAMGGRGETFDQAFTYLTVIMWGAVFQVLASGCIPLIRNKGHVIYALCALASGGLLNCVLDYVTVVQLNLGVTGAALSTIAAQVLVFIFGLVFFIRSREHLYLADFLPNRKLICDTLRIGFAPFALTLLPEVTTLVINIASGVQGGETAQAAFAVISYVVVAVQWIIQGINDGSQPLISMCYGQEKVATVRSLRRTNYTCAITIGLLGTILLITARGPIAALFGISAEASDIFDNGVVIFSLGLVCYGFTHATTSFFYAIERSREASLIIIGEAVLIVATSIILPSFLGLNGVWLSVFVTQILLCILSGVLLIRFRLQGSDAHRASVV
ncbi:MAG: MATE family efflux transporter [Eggerthellaceae bacterium]|jgi:putative MATE family efflux protein|nr:MATE family efflux transporter [Eggerthellaceae bacterium]MCH4221435.1 MATE family efflux transporter [Eggerthellaceae bacterium]